MGVRSPENKNCVKLVEYTDVTDEQNALRNIRSAFCFERCKRYFVRLGVASVEKTRSETG
jgi:hypothetical protein